MDKDLQDILEKNEKLRKLFETNIELLKYPSYGISRPPQGSRAATLIETNWLLRRYILTESNRSGKSSSESKELLNLTVQASKVDRRIYEVGQDDERANVVAKEVLRPFSEVVRGFSAKRNTMLTQPIWSASQIPVDTNKILYSGSAFLRNVVDSVCERSGLSVMQKPSGASFAKNRYKQIQKSIVAFFDLGFEDGSLRASVAYELGIALACGKPVVLAQTADYTVPFDVEAIPITLDGSKDDQNVIGTAIDSAIAWTYDPPRATKIRSTLDYILANYSRPHPNVYVDQMIRSLAEQKEKNDPLTLNYSIRKFVDFLEDGNTTTLYPQWTPVYPDAENPRLFHVMPYTPAWADEVTFITRRACLSTGVEYVRGDEMTDPDVIRSIWEEIGKSTHVLVDLTDFSANVALELGIAHTLGRPCLIVGQVNTVEKLQTNFPMIARQRFYTYREATDLGALVEKFLIQKSAHPPH